ncbi:hypothetical protein ACFWSF_36140 [Streptomyces sp. NPDC058611]|uniref:hypothetical protein n=1 Tax=unclassified Streptomyces TaxID=2593676 RepID=UPI00366096DF
MRDDLFEREFVRSRSMSPVEADPAAPFLNRAQSAGSQEIRWFRLRRVQTQRRHTDTFGRRTDKP